MKNLIFLGMMVGLDNFRIAASIKMTSPQQVRHWWMILSFAFFETLMPLLGLALGSMIQAQFEAIAEWIGTLALFLSGTLILLTAGKGSWKEN